MVIGEGEEEVKIPPRIRISAVDIRKFNIIHNVCK